MRSILGKKLVDSVGIGFCGLMVPAFDVCGQLFDSLLLCQPGRDRQDAGIEAG